MAFWQRRRGKQVVVYVWSGGKQRALPRATTRHLDSEPDHNVDWWVHDWEARNGAADEEQRPTDPRLQGWIDRYVADIRKRRSPKTASDHRHHLAEDVIPYFVRHLGLVDPNDWPRHSARMAAWLRDQGRSEHQIQKANTALRAWWRWLGDEGTVLHGLDLRVRAAIRTAAPTPLSRLVSPDEVLAHVQSTTSIDTRIAAILGYFFSLRPQEVMALRRCDFVAGASAAKLEACRTSARLGQFGRLAVHVHRQRLQSGEFAPPKAHSVGWVACFDERAARILVEILRSIEPDAPLFVHQNDWCFERWKRHGISAITLKDLRRASCYWLGHNTRFAEEPISAMKHMRHKDFETTLGYLRRPTETVELVDLDLDA